MRVSATLLLAAMALTLGFGAIYFQPTSMAALMGQRQAGADCTSDATVSALATGGGGGTSDTLGGLGGEADASSTATTSGSGNASSTATATGGGPIESFDFVDGSNATATADASATGGGKAMATAVATQGFPSNIPGFPFPPSTAAANATSNAVTVNGAMADAQSTAGGTIGEAQSTAKTSLGGVSVQSAVMAPSSSPFLFGPTTTEAIVQGGSGPTFVDGQPFAISTVLWLTIRASKRDISDASDNPTRAARHFEVFSISQIPLRFHRRLVIRATNVLFCAHDAG